MIVKSQVEIRGRYIDQAKEFLKKVTNCKSQTLSDNQVFFDLSTMESIILNLLIKPVYITLKNETDEKNNQKVC